MQLSQHLSEAQPETFEMVRTKGVVNMEELREVLLDPQANQVPIYIRLFIFCQEIAKRKGRMGAIEVTAVSRTPESGSPELYRCEYLCEGARKYVTIPSCFVTLDGEAPQEMSKTTIKTVSVMPAAA